VHPPATGPLGGGWPSACARPPGGAAAGDHGETRHL